MEGEKGCRIGQCPGVNPITKEGNIMSFFPRSMYAVPEETARVARAIFPKGNLYMQWYDTFGMLYADEDFRALFAPDGQPALSPVRLSLVLILQFAEGLSDRQAAEAVRTRIDWKYLLGLALTDQGFHYSVLSEFRDRLLSGGMEQQLFEKVLEHLKAHQLLKVRGQQRTDSTQVLGAVRSMNRLELVVETIRYALNGLAIVAPAWTVAHSQAEWVERYGERASDYRLPQTEAERLAYANMVGADGLAVLLAGWEAPSAAWFLALPAVQILWQVWLQNYTWTSDSHLRWRSDKEVPPASIAIRSPYDPEAHYGKKRDVSWLGYKVHFTETCDPDRPRLITHVETTPAPVQDVSVTTPIHQALETKDCLPATHIVDSGYVDAHQLVTSPRDYQIDLLGPTRLDTGWQAIEGTGFTSRDFTIDWDNHVAHCPAGKTSLHWMPAANNHGTPVIQIKFSKHDCRLCALQAQCTRSHPPRRSITVYPEAEHKALSAAREREKTGAFAQQYATRAGVEGTISQATRAFGVRQTRYIGLAKTHLQHVLTAIAMNMVRALRWLAGDHLAQTRRSAFAKLYLPAA
jgi:transposase